MLNHENWNLLDLQLILPFHCHIPPFIFCSKLISGKSSCSLLNICLLFFFFFLILKMSKTITTKRPHLIEWDGNCFQADSKPMSQDGGWLSKPTNNPALPTMVEKTKHEKLINNFIYEKGWTGTNEWLLISIFQLIYLIQTEVCFCILSLV